MEPFHEVDDATSFSHSSTTQSHHPPFNLLEPHSSPNQDIILDTIPMNTCFLDDYCLAQSFPQPPLIAVDDDDYIDSYTQMEWHSLLESSFQGTVESNTDALSSAAGSHPSAFLCRDQTSSTVPAKFSNASFIHASPSFSDVSSFPAHQFHSTNHSSECVDINSLMSVSMSCSQRDAHRPAHTLSTDNSSSSMVASEDEFFYSDVSSFLPTSSPPHKLNVDMAIASPPALNLDAAASQLYLNGGTGASLLQQELPPSLPCADKPAWVSKHQQDQNDVDAVSFLVNNSTLSIDDGYVWRKYGQKNIKDKLHPRAYYRCAQPDCPVKKQIENSSDMQGCVLITYLNRHNHHPSA